MTGIGRIVAGAYEWEIADYEQYQKQTYAKGEFLESPTFSIGKHSWNIQLYPLGYKEDDNDVIILVPEDGKVMATFSMTILDSNIQILMQTNQGKTKEIDCEGWSVSNMITASIEKEPDILKSKFIILCEIMLDSSNHYDKIITHRSERLQCFETFELSIDNEEFSDVKLSVENKHIHAHKIILASGSKAFAAIFRNDMKENQENVVNIKGISYDVLLELVRFIYSGKVSRIKELAKELLVAANEYLITELKSICEQQLCDELSVSNAIEYLSLSDTNGAAVLKKEATSFIVMNMEEILDLEEFDAFMKLDIAVVKDVFREFLSTHKALLAYLETFSKSLDAGTTTVTPN